MDEKVAREMAKIRLTGALMKIEGSASGARLALGMVREIDWEGVEAVLQDIEREIVAIRKADKRPLAADGCGCANPTAKDGRCALVVIGCPIHDPTPAAPSQEAPAPTSEAERGKA